MLFHLEEKDLLKNSQVKVRTDNIVISDFSIFLGARIKSGNV